jgi:hypothetical protein
MVSSGVVGSAFHVVPGHRAMRRPDFSVGWPDLYPPPISEAIADLDLGPRRVGSRERWEMVCKGVFRARLGFATRNESFDDFFPTEFSGYGGDHRGDGRDTSGGRLWRSDVSESADFDCIQHLIPASSGAGDECYGGNCRSGQ